MRITVTFLGLDLFGIEVDTAGEDGPGDCTSERVETAGPGDFGFTAPSMECDR